MSLSESAVALGSPYQWTIQGLKESFSMYQVDYSVTDESNVCVTLLPRLQDPGGFDKHLGYSAVSSPKLSF
jgi:hypothetical protein